MQYKKTNNNFKINLKIKFKINFQISLILNKLVNIRKCYKNSNRNNIGF